MDVEEVLSLYSKGTQYEEAHGIGVGDWKLMKDCGNIKFYGRKKADGSTTLLLIFRAGLTNNWCGWMPSEDQASTLKQYFPSVYEYVEKINRERRLA